MSKIEVNTVAPQCGTTLTLGESGDTVTLGSGASQSGFGRTGTVDWQTGSIKTANFTAANGEGYFCNTTSGAFRVDLPAGSAGAIVSVQDYNNTFDSESLTIKPNGSEKINGGAGEIILDTEGEGLTLVYIDSTVGWRSIHNSTFADVGSAYMVATGGTETTSGNFKIHTFTGPGTFQITNAGASPSPSANNVFDYMVVGGGGAGAPAAPSNGAGGGGAGGYRESSGAASSYSASPLGACVSGKTAVVGSYPITVGGGGAAPPSAYPNPTKVVTPGSNSVMGFSPAPITSTGGGGGGLGQPDSTYAGGPGGSGGGGGGYATGGLNAGSGNTPPVAPPQGNNGGTGSPPSTTTNYRGGGGGGALHAGNNGGPSNAAGGGGTTSDINGTPTARAGGGGGGCTASSSFTKGAGGSGGGGAGGAGPGNTAVAGTVNTGGGGGGGGFPQSPTAVVPGGAGGSGIVIIRYKFQ